MEPQTSKRDRKKAHKEDQKVVEQKNQNKNFLRNLGIGVAAVLLFGGAWLVFGNSAGNTPTNTNQDSQSSIESVVLSESDHVRGNREAAVVLVEYGDFQCPACGIYSPVVNQLVEEFGDDLAVVFRHMPLSTIHQNAESSSFAAEAAGKQGKFWEMADILFERQEDWSNDRDPRSKYEGYAAELGLNVDQFKEDSNSPEVKEKVRRDRQQALAFRITGTPTFFLNGEKIESPRGLDPFRDVISAAIAQTGEPQAEETNEATPEED